MTASGAAGQFSARPAGATGVGCMNASKEGPSPEPPGDQGSKDDKRSRHCEGTTDVDMEASYQGSASSLAGKGKEREEPGSDEEDSDDDISDSDRAGKDDARGGIKQPPLPAGQPGPACWRPRGRARCPGRACTQLCLGLSPAACVLTACRLLRSRYGSSGAGTAVLLQGATGLPSSTAACAR